MNNQTKASPAGQLPFIGCPRSAGALQAVAAERIVLRRVCRTGRGEIDAVEIACGGGRGNLEINGEGRAAGVRIRLLNGALRAHKINRRQTLVSDGKGGAADAAGKNFVAAGDIEYCPFGAVCSVVIRRFKSECVGDGCRRSARAGRGACGDSDFNSRGIIK